MQDEGPANSFCDAPLIATDALGDPDAQSIVLGSGIERLDVIVVRVNGETHAYVNECPHALTTLETFDGRFFDTEDQNLLVCSTHGARFEARTGFCVSGPCKGKRLRPVSVSIEGGIVRTAR